MSAHHQSQGRIAMTDAAIATIAQAQKELTYHG